MVERFVVADTAGAEGKVVKSHVTSKRDSADACHRAKAINPDRFNLTPAHQHSISMRTDLTWCTSYCGHQGAVLLLSSVVSGALSML
jgi:hypothetical protein